MTTLREAAQRRKDLKGQKFGRLSVVEFDNETRIAFARAIERAHGITP